MTLLQRQSLELEAIRRNEFKGDLDLLKIMHEKEIMECRFQIKSLMDGDSIAEYRRDYLEKTTEDLKAVVCSQSLALEKLRETHEKDLEEARSKVTQLNKELKNVKSELASCKWENIQMGSQFKPKPLPGPWIVSSIAVVKLNDLSFDHFDSEAMIGTFTATTDSVVQAPIEVEAIIKYGRTKVRIHDVNLG